MALQILQKKLDESTFCPLCQASMFFIEAEEFDQELYYHQCSHCEHQTYLDNARNCHCQRCAAQRKKLIAQTKLQEQRKRQKKTDVIEKSLDQLNFMHKLFLLSLLDGHVREGATYAEFIDLNQLKYQTITPNGYFQTQLLDQLIKDNVLIAKEFSDDCQQYYINIRLDGYSEPSLFSITQQLRYWFYENLMMGIPFKSAEEVKNTLYAVLYQEIVQFMQYYCKTWGILIAGNTRFQTFCYRLMDTLAPGQIFYMIQTALEYLYKQKALQVRNEKFINTNILRKTLEQYRDRSLSEKWETATLPRPTTIPLSKMSHILFTRFLKFDEHIFYQPVWKMWKKIEPRLNFHSVKRCMYCGSNELNVEYDAESYITMTCRYCKHQDHYFTQ